MPSRSQGMNQKSIPTSTVSRRRLLKLSTVGGSLALAGCTGLTGGDGGDGGDGEYVNRAFRLRCRNPLDQETFNQWNSARNDILTMTMARPLLFSYNKQKYVPVDAESYTLDTENDEVRIKLRDNLIWSDGKQVTAEDLVLLEELGRHMTPEDARPDHPLFTGWRAEGDNNKIFVAELNSDGYNEGNALWDLMAPYGAPTIHIRRDSVFADKLEAIKGASTTKEADKAREEVTKITQRLPDVNLSTPWIPKSSNKQLAIFDLNTDHWAADKFNFDTLEIKFISTDVTRQAVFGNDQIDTQHGMPPDTSLSKGHQLLASIRDSTHCLSFNGDPPQEKHQFLTNPKVRQAIAYILDRTKIVENAKYGLRAVEVPSGAVDRTAKEVIPDLYEKLRSYGMKTTDKHLQKATQLLKEEGFSKQKGKWIKPDGNAAQFPILSMPWSRGQAITAANQLQNFGIQGEHVAKDGPTGVQAYWGTQEYVTAIGECNSPRWGFPYTFRTVAGGQTAFNAPNEYEVPMPLGDYEGSMETIQTNKLANELRVTPMGDRFKELSRQLAWVFNYHLPGIPFNPLKFAHNLNVHGHVEWPQPKPKDEAGRYEVKESHHQVWGIPQTSRVLTHGTGGTKLKPKE